MAGALALLLLPVAEFPELTPPQVQVQASYRGANAAVVEETIAAVIEPEVNGVEGMTYMSSKERQRRQLQSGRHLRDRQRFGSGANQRPEPSAACLWPNCLKRSLGRA